MRPLLLCALWTSMYCAAAVIEEPVSVLPFDGQISIGVDLFSPTVRYELPSSSQLAIGIAVAITELPTPGQATRRGWGAFGTASWHSAGDFEGLWLFGKVGVLPTRLDDGQQQAEFYVTPAAALAAGLRVRLWDGWRLGVAGGVTGLLLSSNRVSRDAPRIFPSLIVELGWRL